MFRGLLTKTVHHHLQESLAAGNVTLDGDFLITSKYQDFDGTGSHLEVVSDFVGNVAYSVAALQVQQYAVGLANGFFQAVANRVSANNGLQVEHFKME